MQAFFSACAKMCVRELRKTETANVSVFYLSFCSTIGALVGTLAPKLFGVKESIRMPHDIEWLLLVGVGEFALSLWVEIVLPLWPTLVETAAARRIDSKFGIPY